MPWRRDAISVGVVVRFVHFSFSLLALNQALLKKCHHHDERLDSWRCASMFSTKGFSLPHNPHVAPLSSAASSEEVSGAAAGGSEGRGGLLGRGQNRPFSALHQGGLRWERRPCDALSEWSEPHSQIRGKKIIMRQWLALRARKHFQEIWQQCSEGYQLETDAMEAMREGRPAPPLCVHTSAGSPPALSRFIDAIGKHSPWNSVGGHDNGREDWFLTLQVEGSSAVWAAVDCLLQMQISIRGCPHRDRIAVADVSYHGPQSMSLGSGFRYHH